MISVTADSNIYISGLIYAGPPRQFLDAARARLFQLCLSPALLDEELRHCITLRSERGSGCNSPGLLTKSAFEKVRACRLVDFFNGIHPICNVTLGLSPIISSRCIKCQHSLIASKTAAQGVSALKGRSIMICPRCRSIYFGKVLYGEGIEVSCNPVIRHYDGNCGNCGAVVPWHAEWPAPGSQGFRPQDDPCPASCPHHKP